MKEYIRQLVEISDQFDREGHYVEADAISSVIVRLAQKRVNELSQKPGIREAWNPAEMVGSLFEGVAHKLPSSLTEDGLNTLMRSLNVTDTGYLTRLEGLVDSRLGTVLQGDISRIMDDAVSNPADFPVEFQKIMDMLQAQKRGATPTQLQAIEKTMENIKGEASLIAQKSYNPQELWMRNMGDTLSNNKVKIGLGLGAAGLGAAGLGVAFHHSDPNNPNSPVVPNTPGDGAIQTVEGSGVLAGKTFQIKDGKVIGMTGGTNKPATPVAPSGIMPQQNYPDVTQWFPHNQPNTNTRPMNRGIGGFSHTPPYSPPQVVNNNTNNATYELPGYRNL